MCLKAQNSFFYSFKKYWLTPYFVLGSGDRAVNKVDMNLWPHEAHILVGQITNKEVNYVICFRYLHSEGIKKGRKRRNCEGLCHCEWSSQGGHCWKGNTEVKSWRRGRTMPHMCLGHKCKCKECSVLVNIVWFNMFLVWVNFEMLTRDCWLNFSICITSKQISAYGNECHFEQNKTKQNTWTKSWFEHNIYKEPCIGHKHV